MGIGVVIVNAGHVLGAAVALAVSALGLAGCASQLEALAPVGGDDVASVRAAATDVLLANNLEILEAPTCEKSETEITCEGALIDGSAILVTAPLEPFEQMTIIVAGEELYDGSIQQVLDDAIQGTTP